MIDISFPWPPAALSPNARVHWATKAKAAKKYKEDCRWVCKASRRCGDLALGDVDITFHPPSKRRADADNMLASFKVGLDAISEFTGIDDSKFAISFRKSDPVKGGEVRVLIA